MNTFTMNPVGKKNSPTHSYTENLPKAATALYHCEACGAWWGKDVEPSNPLARFALFLAHTFDWRDYHGWHTGEGIDYACPICDQPNPEIFTL